MISIIPLSGALLGLYWLRWLLWKRKEQPAAVPVLFTCFFLPKLNLLKVSALSTAGIRADDLLALVLLLIAVMDPATYRHRAVKWGRGSCWCFRPLTCFRCWPGGCRDTTTRS